MPTEHATRSRTLERVLEVLNGPGAILAQSMATGVVRAVLRAPDSFLITVGEPVDPVDPVTVRLVADLLATMRTSPGCVGRISIVASGWSNIGHAPHALNGWDGPSVGFASRPAIGDTTQSRHVPVAGST